MFRIIRREQKGENKKLNKIMNYQEHLDKINNKERYTFSRFGDGEWNAILEKAGSNCDGHQYFRDMGARLKDVLASSPSYYVGLQNLAHQQNTLIIDNYSKEFGIKWVASDIFHHASIKGNLQPLFDALSKRNVVIVGGSHLKSFNSKWKFIEVPQHNCWTEYKSTLTKIQEFLLNNDADSISNPKDFVILFCASMMSNVLIDDLDPIAEVVGVTLLDMGSLFDPYVGVNSRSYHNKLNLKKDV
jgi:hypothetical protein